MEAIPYSENSLRALEILMKANSARLRQLKRRIFISKWMQCLQWVKESIDDWKIEIKVIEKEQEYYESQLELYYKELMKNNV